MTNLWLIAPTTILFASVFVFPAQAQEEPENDFELLFSNLEVHGFYEIRSGYRTRKDKYQKDMSVMENRLQLDLSSYTPVFSHNNRL